MTEQKPSEMSPHLLTPKNHQSSLRTSSNKHIKEIKVCVYNLGNPTSFLLITHFVCFLNLWLLVFLFFWYFNPGTRQIRTSQMKINEIFKCNINQLTEKDKIIRKLKCSMHQKLELYEIKISH